MDLSRLKTTRSIANLRAGRNDWFRIKAQADGPTQVMIYDEIGWFGVTAQDFIDQLKQVNGPIDLHLNSPGGEVFDGIAIHGFLAGRGGVTTYVDSLAASIASVIAMAGEEIVMGRNASMMIHDGWGMCIGNAADMREQASLLDRVSDNIASIYAERTGKPADEWRKAMLGESWYIGQEAVDAGLADRLADPPARQAKTAQDDDTTSRMAAHFDLSVFRNTPDRLRNLLNHAVAAPADDPPPSTTDTATEAPADTDRGFSVPANNGERGSEPEQPPGVRVVEIEWSGENAGDELLAWLRQNIRVKGAAGHAPFDGTHTHAHPAFGEQGDDATHEHEHTHDGDADHHHGHDGGDAMNSRRGTVKAAAPYEPEPYSRDDDETVQCPGCEKYNDPDARFCDQCGMKLLGRDDVAPVGDTAPPSASRLLGAESMPLLNKALPVHHTATVDEPWDGPAAVAAMPNDDKVLRYCHAWMSAEAAAEKSEPDDDDADDQKSSYKFPHHKTEGGPANLAACRNGLARLEGSSIPDADKPGVKAHLQAHLDDAASDSDDSSGASNHTHEAPGDAWSWDPEQFRSAMKGA